VRLKSDTRGMSDAPTTSSPTTPTTNGATAAVIDAVSEVVDEL